MKDQIKQAFEKVTGRDLDDYEWDLNLEGDLDMDGLDFVEFIMCLESQLQISIPDDTAESLSTPNQWLAYLDSISKVAILTLSEQPKSHGFCVTPNSNCSMNYCDDNGCQDRRRELVEQPKVEESQEELTALNLKMFIERELGGYKTVHTGRSYRVINRQFVYESDIMSLAEDLLRNFTITRNQ